MMSRRLIAAVVLGGLVVLLAGSVPAQDAKKPDATVKLSEGTVAAGIGWSWGKGTLTYKGKAHRFKVEGLDVGDVGITKAEATGNVFNLKKVEDFSGIYRAAAIGGTAVKGAGATALQNEKGVAQGSMEVNLPLKDQGELAIGSEASMDLHNDTGDAWFPDGHAGEVTESELTARYSNEWAGFDWTFGIDNYNLMNGAEFAVGTAFGARGPTTELFLSLSHDGFVVPALSIHYDIDEVDGGF